MTGGGEIHDAQTLMSKNADAGWRRPKATIIRTSMGDAGNHSINCFALRARRPVKFAGYAARGIGKEFP